MKAQDLKFGNKYKFKCQDDTLIFIGKQGLWNQFERENEIGIVWCEILDSDLYLIEPMDC